MVMLKFTLGIGLANASQYDEFEVDDSELQDDDGNWLEGDAKDDALHSIWKDWTGEYVDGYCEVVDGSV